MGILEPLRDSVGTALFERVAGPEGSRRRDRIHGRPGPRWFEPDTPIMRVHSDASMFIGGIRALLLQSLHPVAMQAVADHSDYRGDPWGRVARTSAFIAMTTFGHSDDAEAAVDAVRRIHRQINGTMPDGTPYEADDPHLLRWVHIAEIDSFLAAHQAFGAHPLGPLGRDRYVDQTAEIARRLGVLDPPTSERELADALEEYRKELKSTPAAREAVSYLLRKPPLPVPARPPYAVLAAAAVALMPRWSRRPLRLPWLPITERTVVRTLGGVATKTIRWAMPPPAQLTPTDPELAVS